MTAKEALEKLNKAIHTMTLCGVTDKYPLEQGWISRDEWKNMLDVMGENKDVYTQIIETALNRLEEKEHNCKVYLRDNNALISELRKADKKIKELESRQPIVLGGRMSGKQNIIAEKLQRLEELEKVLKVIRTKCSCFFSIFDKDEFGPGFGYMVFDGELYQHNDLTKEEFELLKEYLK